jgi:hypothetical protein
LGTITYELLKNKKIKKKDSIREQLCTFVQPNRHPLLAQEGLHLMCKLLKRTFLKLHLEHPKLKLIQAVRNYEIYYSSDI